MSSWKETFQALPHCPQDSLDTVFVLVSIMIPECSKLAKISKQFFYWMKTIGRKLIVVLTLQRPQDPQRPFVLNIFA